MRINSATPYSVLTVILSLMLCLLSAPIDAADDVWEGVYVYQKRMADYGHPEAQIKLGEMYEEGHGVGKDYDTAQQWYEKAAAQGYGEAEEKLIQLEQRRKRDAEQSKLAEQRRIAEEKAKMERLEQQRQAQQARAEQQRKEQERLAVEAEQARLKEQRAAQAAVAEEKRLEEERLARRRAAEAAKAMMDTPDAF